eukprot:TRINITY_DN123929_c0_g1_i1.p1 TRINITY_DN123929_c0_g1~~TRINITY_DN123929_c0_g1_i1.p1  ORF type:complete len:455 (+),score=107.28 TRINITY_DN123929_c0_g1_i1:190-1554(+)
MAGKDGDEDRGDIVAEGEEGLPELPHKRPRPLLSDLEYTAGDPGATTSGEAPASSQGPTPAAQEGGAEAMDTSNQSDVDKAQCIDYIRKMVDNELGHKIPANVQKHIKKMAFELQKKVETFQKTADLVKKMQADLDKANGENGLASLPAKARAAIVPFESPIWDNLRLTNGSPVSNVKVEGNNIFQPNMSCREAKNAVQIALSIVQLQIDLFGAKQKVSELQQFCGRKAFVERCKTAYADLQKVGTDLNVLFDDDDNKFENEVSSDYLDAKCKIIFQQVINKAMQLRIQNEERDKAAGKKKEELIKVVIKNKPEDLFEKAVEQNDVLASKGKIKGKSKGKGGGAGKGKNEVNLPGLYTAVVTGNNLDKSTVESNMKDITARPKNDLSPVQSGGTTSKGKGKRNGKAEKSDPKGKGKGAQPASSTSKPRTGKTGKGKGRGSGKGKGKKGNGKGKK